MALLGVTISFIPELIYLKLDGLFYYFLSLPLLIFIIYIMRKKEDSTLPLFFLLIYIDFSICYFSIINGEESNAQLYFFPTLIGAFFLFTQERKNVYFMMLFMSLVFWISLDLFGYDLATEKRLSDEALIFFKYFHKSNAIIMSILFGVVLFIAQNDYEEEVIKNENQYDESLKFKNNLLREFHHRSKNNLFMINNILHLKRRDSNDPKVIELINETKNRIITLSNVHGQLLNAEAFDELNFKDYVTDLIWSIVRTYTTPDKITLDIKVDDIFFHSETTIYLGLIVNEILSNALKYAYNENEKGHLFFKLTKHPNHIHIEIGDHGKGFSQEDVKSNSLGLNLIESLVNHLEGTYERLSNNGVQYSIKFPLS